MGPWYTFPVNIPMHSQVRPRHSLSGSAMLRYGNPWPGLCNRCTASARCRCHHHHCCMLSKILNPLAESTLLKRHSSTARMNTQIYPYKPSMKRHHKACSAAYKLFQFKKLIWVRRKWIKCASALGQTPLMWVSAGHSDYTKWARFELIECYSSCRFKYMAV